MLHGAAPLHEQQYRLVITIIFVLSAVALGLRFYTRLRITKTFAIDDWLLLLTLLLLTGSSTLWLETLRISANFPGTLLALFEELSPLFVGSVVLYYSSCLTLRVSLAIFFLRLVFRPWHRYVIINTVAIYTAIVVSGLSLFLFRCGLPITAFRIVTDSSGPVSIEAAKVLTYVMTASNALCDWAFAIIPFLVIVRSCRQELSSRIAVCLPIVLAVIGSTVAIARLPFLGLLTSPSHYFQDSAPSVFLSLIETQIGIMAISLATLKPLLTKIGESKQRITTRRWPHKRAMDVEAANKPRQPWQSSTFTPTVDYKSIDLDTSVLKGIGILPDLPTDGDGKSSFGSSRMWLSSKSTVMKDGSCNSITQLMYSNGGFRDTNKKSTEVAARDVAWMNQTV